MKRESKPPGDDYQIRCPRLGHQITFSYCRSENMGMPCFKTIDCWFEHFPVEEYLRKELRPEEWQKVFNRRPKSRIVALIELMEQTKNKNKEES